MERNEPSNLPDGGPVAWFGGEVVEGESPAYDACAGWFGVGVCAGCWVLGAGAGPPELGDEVSGSRRRSGAIHPEDTRGAKGDPLKKKHWGPERWAFGGQHTLGTGEPWPEWGISAAG
ncbi:hypothetical protein K456DRAFT_40932 [Colletotrichum gloeosporioides 23]|nr:hypothetical protein K456DRAFT_40932 [Colletotrichum gloeosporioides 23]